MGRKGRGTRRVEPDAIAPDPAIRIRPLVIGVIATAAVLRVAASWNDLWLDEIWTLNLLGTVSSWTGIFTELRHDNNHLLNSVLVYWLRPLGSDWVYRLPAVVAGVATVTFGAMAAGRGFDTDTSERSRARAIVIATVVLGVSHPLVHYASEARGYALALGWGAFALWMALDDDVRPRSPRAPIVWAAISLAILGHALAVHLLVALIVWTAVRVVRRGEGLRRGLGTLAWWYAIPTAVFGGIYLGFLRGVRVGGGNREGLVPPLLDALEVMTGMPGGTPAGVLLAVGLTGLGIGIALEVWRGRDTWVLFLVGVVLSPAALALVQPTDLWAPRYFLVSMFLWLVLMARVAAAGLAGLLWVRVVTVLLLVGFVFGNVAQVATLLRDGRGTYVAALQTMAAATPGEDVTIASDHDFRNRLVVDYYGPRIAGGRVRYVGSRDVGPVAPRWYIAHRGVGDAAPPTRLVYHATTYRLAVSYPTASLSGFRWFVYRRESP